MEFELNGNLPIGIREMTWDEFKSEFSWSAKREELILGLEKVCKIIRYCGGAILYVDGSFVTNKLEPNDWDACFEVHKGVSVNNFVNALSKHYPLRNRFDQKRLYLGELYYAELLMEDEDDGFIKCLDFFQRDKKTNKPKGIIKIKI